MTTLEHPPVQSQGPEQPSFQPEKKDEKKGLSVGARVGIGAGAVVLAGSAVGGGAFLLNQEQGPAPAPTNNETGENVPGNPDDLESGTIVIEIAPETLESLTPEEITEQLSIDAVDANGQPISEQAFGENFVTSYEAAINAGNTRSEYDALVNEAAGTYVSAMQAKYNPASEAALFVPGSDTANLPGKQEYNLVVGRLGFSGANQSYKENIDLTDLQVVEPRTGVDDDFTVEVTLNFTNNAEAIGLTEFFESGGKDINEAVRTEKYSLHVQNVNGKLVSTLSVIG
jgi:hypothetical protein